MNRSCGVGLLIRRGVIVRRRSVLGRPLGIWLAPLLTGRRRTMGETPKYYHGGYPGLDMGDVLRPSPPHKTDGCPVCVARAAGRVMRVGEYLKWLAQFGQKAAPALALLADADDAEPVDPPSARNAVYITTDLDYALWYGSRSAGDVYVVKPIGPVEHSTEDSFPSWTCESARVIGVVTRKARLRYRERNRLLRRWKEMDDRKLSGSSLLVEETPNVSRLPKSGSTE
jgi:hypothetical protein